MYIHPFFKLLFITLIAVAVLNFLGTSFFLYWRIWGFDLLVHFLGGVWSAGIIIWIFYTLGFFSAGISSRIKVYIIGIVSGLVIGIIWEFFEIFIGNTVIGENQFLMDTITDLVADVLGAWTITYYFLQKDYIIKSEVLKTD